MKRVFVRASGVGGAALFLCAALAAAGPLLGKVLLSQEEALRLAFPGATVARRTVVLSEEDRATVAGLAGGPKPPALQVLYEARKEGGLVGTAYFDVHVVRTQPEVLMIVVGRDGAVTRLEVLSFSEPDEYLPRTGWYDQFPGKSLSEELSDKRAIRPVTGATLTVRATVEAARRVLAIHRLLARRVTP